MFFKLFSIEWTRLTRRSIFWFTLAACVLFIGYSQQQFYTANTADLLSGQIKMPGFAFDLANSLDLLGIVAAPLLVIMAALTYGNDYAQRTNQHWLRRASRSTSLLSKFAVLAAVTLLLQLLTLLVGGLIGWYFKTFTFHAFSLNNVNWTATLAAPFNMTLVTLPCLAFTLLAVAATRSAFGGIAIGLGYTQFIEFLLTSQFYSASWPRVLMRSLYYSGTGLLNSIGNKFVDLTPRVFAPTPAFLLATFYTLLCLTAALWLYRRQDLGG
jgi:hypothetical protein